MMSLGEFSVWRHIFFSFPFYSVVTAYVLKNITLSLPEGTSDHGSPGLLCTPTTWKDVVSFYLFNYIAHTATVMLKPGERSIDFAVTVIGSLFFPAIGLHRGVEALLSAAMLNRCDLTRAARAGALCMLVRSPDWRPAEGEEVPNAVLHQKSISDHPEGTARPPPSHHGVHLVTYTAPWSVSKFGWPVYVHRQIIHGTYNVPDGYQFVMIPPNARFIKSESTTETIKVASTYNFVKAVVAILQMGYAIVTLFRSGGDQIQRYGFAAFGLTVAPYAVMSTVNLLGNLCRSDYASIYMAETSIMDEARRRGGSFYGAVARLEEEKVPSVCSCSYSCGEDIDRLEFSKDSGGNLILRSSSFDTNEKHLEKDSGCCKTDPISTSCSGRLWRIHDLPKKLNYAGIKHDPILLIPNCNPLKLSSKIDTESLPTRHKIQSVALKPVAPFDKKHKWFVTFEPHTYNTRSFFRWRFAKYFLTAFISLIPVVIVATMSHYAGGSTPQNKSQTWKYFVSQWLYTGIASGLWLVLDQEARDANPSKLWHRSPFWRACIYIASASGAIGGYVCVGQMLVDYGSCVWFG